VSYAICNIVCGAEIPDRVRSYLDEIDGDYQDAGFKTLYSGSGDTPAYSGIILSKFDECNNMRAAQLIPRLTANENQMNQARQALAATRERFQELLTEDEETSDEEKKELLDTLPQNPEVLLIWSSS
jgi:hypothetical protein